MTSTVLEDSFQKQSVQSDVKQHSINQSINAIRKQSTPGKTYMIYFLHSDHICWKWKGVFHYQGHFQCSESISWLWKCGHAKPNVLEKKEPKFITQSCNLDLEFMNLVTFCLTLLLLWISQFDYDNWQLISWWKH